MFSKRRFGIGFIFGVGLIVAVTYGVVSADHAWRNYHWDGSGTPVSLTLGDNFPTNAWDISYDDAVVKAFDPAYFEQQASQLGSGGGTQQGKPGKKRGGGIFVNK